VLARYCTECRLSEGQLIENVHTKKGNMYTYITDVFTKFLHVLSLHYVVQASFGNSADCSEM